MSCRAQLLGFPVVLHPIKKTPKGGEHCAQLPIHHQIGNFLIACVMMCASSKICIYRIFPVSLPPLWVAVKETTILLTRPPIETYWLYKVQLNSLKHQSHSVSKSPKKFSFEFHAKKIRRGPKLEGCAFTNFGNSSGTEGESRHERHTYAHNFKGYFEEQANRHFDSKDKFLREKEGWKQAK